MAVVDSQQTLSCMRAAARPRRARLPGRHGFGQPSAITLSCTTILASIEPICAGFRQRDCTPFQTFDWLSAWTHTAGRRREPAIVIGGRRRDPVSAPLAVERGASRGD